jgi:glycerol uptake facilitator-like aquaporin
MVFEQYLTATLQIVIASLSLIFFIFALHTHNENKEQKEISNIIRIGLVVFALIELIGFSNIFNIFPNIGLTHLLATIVMGLLALSLKIQLDLKEELGGEW